MDLQKVHFENELTRVNNENINLKQEIDELKKFCEQHKELSKNTPEQNTKIDY